MLRAIAAGLIVAASGLAVPTADAAPATYAFDKDHTSVQFAIQHHGISTFRGRFNDVDGKVVFDPEKPEASSCEVIIKAASVDTNVPKLDDHLRNPDFFEVEKYPDITFKSTSVKKASRDRLRIAGNLTMHGHTRPVVLDATINFSGIHPLSQYLDKYKDATYAGFTARTTILRSEFDMGLYTPSLSDTVDLILEVELRKQ